MNSSDNEYNVMRQLFSADAEIPDTTRRRIARTCSELEEKPERGNIRLFGKANGMAKGLPFGISRRAAITAAAAFVCVVFAGTALAAGLAHSDLFRTTLGTGIKDNSEARIYEDAFGGKHEYPLFERAEVDEAEAERLLGGYITPLDRQCTVNNVTCTLRDFVIDGNGAGYVSYTLEAPDGTDKYITRFEGTSEVELNPAAGISDPYIEISSSATEITFHADCRTVMNESLSTGTSVYLVNIFALPFPMDTVEGLTLRFGDEAMQLPLDRLVPVREMASSDGAHRLKISPISMIRECVDTDRAECIVSELAIEGSDGEYDVISDEKNLYNAFFSLNLGYDTGEGEPDGPDYKAACTVFNRLVDPEKIVSVRLDTKHTYPQTIDSHDAYDSGDKQLQSEEENPFHFRRPDGIEVFVLTKQTVSECSEDDLKDCAAFLHDYASFEELIADNPRAGNLADRDFVLGQYSGELTDGMMSADEVIDYYLGLLDESCPGQREQVRTVMLRLDSNGDGTCSWRFVKTNIDALWDLSVNAGTGK